MGDTCTKAQQDDKGKQDELAKRKQSKEQDNVPV